MYIYVPRCVFKLKLEQLRHLYLPINDCDAGEENLSLGRLHNLQTLVNISLSKYVLYAFVQLINLKKLVIYDSRSGGDLENLKNVLNQQV